MKDDMKAPEFLRDDELDETLPLAYVVLSLIVLAAIACVATP
jgi:hypothetical protein